MAETQQKTQGEQGGQQFAIHKIYVKDISFEAPRTPAVFTEKWEPKLHVELNTDGRALDGSLHEVVLALTVTVTNAEQSAFLVEVKQCGIFHLTGFSDEDRAAMLGSYCPNLLFPYARETVSDLVTRGGFPQLLLAPVNFDALYARRVEELKQRSAQSAQDSSAAH